MKRALIGSIVALSALYLEAPASAAATDPGLDLGARLGFGIPLGSVSDGNSFSDRLSGQLPIWLDAGYRFTPNIMVGAYFQYGFAFVKNCPDGASCSGHDMRLGVQGQYRLSPGESIDPWFGLGVGLEWLGLSASQAGQEGSSTTSGLEFLNLQGGADFAVAEGLGVGPFVSFSLGQYSSQSIDVPGLGSVSGDIDKKAMHEWLVFGVRGTYGL